MGGTSFIYARKYDVDAPRKWYNIYKYLSGASSERGFSSNSYELFHQTISKFKL